MPHQSAAVPVNPQYGFAVARELYQQRSHPRLLCGPADLERLRERAAAGWGRTLLDAVRAKLAPVLAAAGDRLETLSPTQLADLAVVAALDRDDARLALVGRVLAAIPELAATAPANRGSYAFAHLGTLPLAFDLAYHHMDDQQRSRYVKWQVEQGIDGVLPVLRSRHYLRCAGMNIPMVGLISALLGLLAVEGEPGVPGIPGVPGAAEADLSAPKAELLRYLEAALYSSLGPQGYPAEDIGYGTLMTGRLAWLVEAVRRAGLYDAYADCPRFARFGRAMLHFTQPWGRFLSNTGDYGAEFESRQFILPRLAAETADPSLLWLLGTIFFPTASAGPNPLKQYRRDNPEIELAEGFHLPADGWLLLALGDLSEPVHPSRLQPPTAFMDEDRGIVSFRSSWEEDATFVVFDGSQRPAGAQGHAHDSGGHFSLSALGEYFAIDTGRYNIEQEHHNVVIVNGRSGHVGDGTWKSTAYQARLTGYEPGPFVDSASVDSSQMSSCYWARRTLGLVKGPHAPAWVWTVEDVNHANDYAEFWWLLNAHPDSRIELADDRATLHGATHGHLLDVHFALPDPAAYPRPHELELTQEIALGGSPKEYGGDPHATALAYRERAGYPEWGPSFERPRLAAKVKGYNGRFLALLIPRRKDQPPAQVERLPSMDNSLAVRVTFEDVCDTFIWAYEHHLLEAGGIVGRGQWCLVRQDRRSGAVLAHAMGKGSRLAVEGTSLPVGG